MDHRYIDDHSVATRYLARALSPQERVEFEAHLVDCQECADRVLLAEMFHNCNGHVKEHPPKEHAPEEAPPKPPQEAQALRVRFEGSLTTWQRLWLFAAGAALLVLGPALLLVWVLER